MALQSEFFSPQGILLSEAYSKIDKFHGDKEFVTFNVFTYSSMEARQSNYKPVSKMIFTVPYTDGMTISSLYEYLKSLPEFLSATDV